MAEATLGLGSRAPARIDARRFLLLGWATILTVFGGLVAWAVFAPFEGAVVASGHLAVESRHKAVQHREGGIVAERFVREGDRVQEGQVLLRLDGAPIKAELETLEARLINLFARAARLTAELDASGTLSPRPVPDDLRESEALAAALAIQRDLMAARSETRATRSSILRQRISQLRERVQGLEAEVQSKRDQSVLIDQELADLKTLLDKGLTPRPRILALERQKSALFGEIEALRAQIAETQVRIGETQLEILSLTEGFTEEVITELDAARTEIAALLSQRRAALDRLQRLDIRAPRAGLVLGVRTNTTGGVIEPGAPIMHIVPDSDALVALVRVAPADIDRIRPGQPARLRFTAFNRDETPEVDATVSNISADAVRDDTTGQTYYEITVNLPGSQPLGAQFPLLPGMPVDAMVRTESRNVLSYLFKPLGDAMSRTFRE